MSLKMSIDYGRSTTKAVSEKDKEGIIFPSWYAKDAVDPNISPTDLVGEYDRLDYLKVKINDQEFNVGKLSKKANYCFDGSSDTDIFPDNYEKDKLTKAEVNILTASALLTDESEQAIDLLTTLPANQFKDIYIKQFKKRLEGETFKVNVYDYEQDKYIDKRIYINSLQIKQQGFCALMHHLLTDDGYINAENNHLVDESVLIFDIGRYSTDLVYIDNMEEIVLENPDIRIKGMDDVFSQIRAEFENKHGFPLNKDKVEDYAKDGKVPIDGNKEDITEIINKCYESFATQIAEQAKNKVPSTLRNIENFLICGGGCEPINDKLQSALKKKLQPIDQPRMANAIGGIKMMKLNDNLEGE